ncbi:hypothetical protein LCGC14_1028480 [marine sediment metagenome]|uniref:Uncharacterized protein n=1 Tax=marine sediment metagenome TaxID=412755 RepID=A0A0F9QDE0_9ZZZZ
MGNINIDIDELARAAQRTVLKKVLAMLEDEKRQPIERNNAATICDELILKVKALMDG